MFRCACQALLLGAAAFGGSSSYDNSEHDQQHQQEDHTSYGEGRYSKNVSRRERFDHVRDKAYSRARPLPTLPWLQDVKPSYIDFAERKYGRMKNWHAIDDEATRSQLLALLHQYVSDLFKLQAKYKRAAAMFSRRCREQRAEYVAWLKKIQRDPMAARDWPLPQEPDHLQRQREREEMRRKQFLAEEGQEEEVGGQKGEEVHDSSRQHQQNPSPSLLFDGSDSLATEAMDVTPHSTVSEYPFLRARAVKEPNTLDPSLASWASANFPNDTPDTFEEPSQNESEEEKEKRAGGHGDSAGSSQLDREARINRRKLRAASVRSRLYRPLEKVSRGLFPGYDGEGVLYLKQDGRKIKKLRRVRGALSGKEDMVKVDWATVRNAKRAGATAEGDRAKERLFRLTRGEDPSGFV